MTDVDIELVWGTGEGATALSAFDAALATAGIHNYNLVELSSVIPPDATVTRTGTHEGSWPVGTVLSTVLSSARSTVAGETIAAGLGWAQASDGGIFLEASAETSENVAVQLDRGLRSAQSQRPEWDWEDTMQTEVCEHTVRDNGAAVIAALYGPLDVVDTER